jgi:hypothetical protein
VLYSDKCSLQKQKGKSSISYGGISRAMGNVVICIETSYLKIISSFGRKKERNVESKGCDAEIITNSRLETR